MILQIQGHSDDVVELLSDTRGNNQLDLLDGESMAVIEIGSEESVQMVITCQYACLLGWVFTLALRGADMHRTGAPKMPGRLDVEISSGGTGPRWIIDVPDDTPIRANVIARAHTLSLVA